MPEESPIEILIIMIFIMLLVVIAVILMVGVFYSLYKHKNKRYKIAFKGKDFKIYQGVLSYLTSKGYTIDDSYEEDNVWRKNTFPYPSFIKPYYGKGTIFIEGWFLYRHGIFGTYEFHPHSLLGGWTQIFLIFHIKSIEKKIQKGKTKISNIISIPIEKKIKQNKFEKIELRNPITSNEFISSIRHDFIFPTAIIIIIAFIILIGVLTIINSTSVNAQDGPNVYVMMIISVIFLPFLYLVTIALGPYMIYYVAPIYGLEKSVPQCYFLDDNLILSFGTIRNIIPIKLISDIKPYGEDSVNMSTFSIRIQRLFHINNKKYGIWYLPSIDRNRVLLLLLSENVPFINIKAVSEGYRPFPTIYTNRIYLDAHPKDHDKIIKIVSGNR